MENEDNNVAKSTYPFLKKVLIFVLIALSVTLMVMFIGRAIDTLLLIFAGILLGIIFRAARDYVHRALHLGHKLSLALVLIAFIGAAIGTSYLLVPRIINQADTFYKEIPKTWEITKRNISQFHWGRELAQENPKVTDFFEDETEGTGEDYDMTKSILGYLSTTATIIAALVLIFVIAVYVAAEPKLYTEGFVRLFPKGEEKGSWRL